MNEFVVNLYKLNTQTLQGSASTNLRSGKINYLKCCTLVKYRDTFLQSKM